MMKEISIRARLWAATWAALEANFPSLIGEEEKTLVLRQDNPARVGVGRALRAFIGACDAPYGLGGGWQLDAAKTPKTISPLPQPSPLSGGGREDLNPWAR